MFKKRSWTTRRLTMKTHIFLALMALIVSACSSRRDLVGTESDAQNDQEFLHVQMIDAQASRIR
jgi:hypothetical protein